MIRLIILGLMRPIGWIVVGLIAVGVGLPLYLSAHVVHPVEVDGTFDTIIDHAQYGYQYSKITLVGNSTVYTFDKNALTPTWPDEFVQDSPVQLWVDQGTTNVVALTAEDPVHGQPIKYVTDEYLHPNQGLQGRTTGLITGGAGLVVTLAAVVWAIVAGNRKRTAKEQRLAAVGAGQNAALQQRYGDNLPRYGGPLPPLPPRPPTAGQRSSSGQ